jgi:hypothetical protein
MLVCLESVAITSLLLQWHIVPTGNTQQQLAAVCHLLPRRAVKQPVGAWGRWVQKKKHGRYGGGCSPGLSLPTGAAVFKQHPAVRLTDLLCSHVMPCDAKRLCLNRS